MDFISQNVAVMFRGRIEYCEISKRPTAGFTGKSGIWRTKPPDAESAAWGRFPESAAERPHLSGARGVGPLLPIN